MPCPRAAVRFDVGVLLNIERALIQALFEPSPSQVGTFHDILIYFTVSRSIRISPTACAMLPADNRVSSRSQTASTAPLIIRSLTELSQWDERRPEMDSGQKALLSRVPAVRLPFSVWSRNQPRDLTYTTTIRSGLRTKSLWRQNYG